MTRMDATTAAPPPVAIPAGLPLAAYAPASQEVTSRAGGAPTRRVVSGGGGAHGAAAGAGNPSWLPMWGQYGVSTAIGHFFHIFGSPIVRNTTERLLGNKVDKPYKPPNTPGFLARELTYGIGVSYLNIALMKALLKRAGRATSENMLTSASGTIGANGALAKGASGAAVTAAFRGMLFRNAVLCGSLAVLDAVWGAKLGGMVESGVNRALGMKQEATTTKEISSNVPMNTVKQTREQTVRQFSRSFIATTTYTIAWQAVGSLVAKQIFGAVGGPVGAIAGAFGGAMATTMFNHVVLWAIGPPVGDALQAATRGVERLLGLPVDAKTPSDVVPKIGDRVANSLEAAVIPFATALIAGQLPQYMKSL